MPPAMTVPVAVPVAIGAATSFDIIIDIRPAQHLSDIRRHAVEDRSCLGVGADMFVARFGKSRRAVRQLRHHEEDEGKDEYRNE